MVYDKKTGTIKVSENATKDDLLQDMFAHFSHVESQIAKDFPEKTKSSSSNTKHKRRGLSKAVRAGIVAMVVWTAFVFYRTVDSHELLGMDLERWSDDYLLVNWLAVPFAVVALIYAIRWIMRDQKPIRQTSKTPLNDFQKELENWNPNDAKLALLLIKATLIGDQKSIDRISSVLTVEQFRKVVAVVKAMRGDE